MNIPKVSICIPVYNSANYLSAAIESAVAQQYENFEVLIVDDCSTDGSDLIANDYAARYKNVRFIHNQTNLGMVLNWNHCIQLARGEYIKFLFGDDILSSPYNLLRLATVLDEHPEVTLSCSFRSIIDPNGNILTERGFTPVNQSISGLLAIRDCLIVARNFIGEPSVVMFRKRDAKRGFSCDYKQMVDLEMWFHLLSKGNIWCEKDSLAAFRRHPDQQTVQNVGELVHLEENLRLYDTYLHSSGIVLPRFLETALYYIQCYRIWKGYIKHQVFSREQATKIISHYINFKVFILLIPVYKILNPIWKLILSAKKHNPL